LRSTGEEVENPDFLYTWTITRPDAEGGTTSGCTRQRPLARFESNVRFCWRPLQVSRDR
jgi:hypothetical protein